MPSSTSHLQPDGTTFPPVTPDPPPPPGYVDPLLALDGVLASGASTAEANAREGESVARVEVQPVRSAE